jgi:hypothetical protein
MLELHYARRARRRQVDLACEVITRDHDEPVLHQLEDISPYGVWLRTSFPRQVGERVVLSFVAPHGEELTVFAEVTRAVPGGPQERRSGMGLEFVDIRQRERVALHRALRDVYREAHARFLMRCVARAS